MDAGFGFFETPKTTNPADNSLSPSWVGEGQGEGGRALISYHPPYHQCRLKYCTSRSCFSAASRVWNVPRLRRLPVFGSTLREYRRYPPAASLRIMATSSSRYQLGGSTSRKNPARHHRSSLSGRSTRLTLTASILHTP